MWWTDGAWSAPKAQNRKLQSENIRPNKLLTFTLDFLCHRIN